MIVVDTHVLVWALESDNRLGPVARRSIETAEREGHIFVSAITSWEIALLVHEGRLVLSQAIRQWMTAAFGLPALRLVPIEPALAVDSVSLPGAILSDPADRLIVATARHLALPLLTADRAIIVYAASGHVQVIDAAL